MKTTDQLTPKLTACMYVSRKGSKETIYIKKKFIKFGPVFVQFDYSRCHHRYSKFVDLILEKGVT